MSSANDYGKFASVRQSQIKSGQKKPHKYVEKPMMQALLPSLEGKKILMLGCGTGEESLILEGVGASELTGIDKSVESIKLAQNTYPQHNFFVGNMEHLELQESTFDFVYSSLVIHYSATPNKVYDEIFRILKPGGQLLFSVSHPIRWSSEKIKINGISTNVIGYSEDAHNPRIYGKYLSFAEHEHLFPEGEVLRLWVGSPSFHFNLLKKSGFIVEEFIESKVVDSCKEVDPYYFERNSELPQFMAFLAKKP